MDVEGFRALFGLVEGESMLGIYHNNPDGGDEDGVD